MPQALQKISDPFAAAPSAPLRIADPFASAAPAPLQKIADPFGGASSDSNVANMAGRIARNTSVVDVATQDIPVLGPLAGMAGSAVSAGLGTLTGSKSMGTSFGERYANEQKAKEMGAEQYRQMHPYKDMLGMGMSAAVLGPLGPETLAPRLAFGAGVGGVDAGLRGQDVKTGALLGTAGSALPEAIQGVKYGAGLVKNTRVGKFIADNLGEFMPKSATPRAPVAVDGEAGQDMAANYRANEAAIASQPRPSLRERAINLTKTIKSTVLPESGGGEEASRLVQKHTGRGKVETAKLEKSTTKLQADIAAMPLERQMQIIDHVQNYSGVPKENIPKEMLPAIKLLQDRAKIRADEYDALHPNDKLIRRKDYYRQNYKNPEVFDQADAQGVNGGREGPQVNQTGNRDFTKERSIPTMRRALELGANPKDANPLDGLMREDRNWALTKTATRIAREAEDTGMVKRILPSEHIPDGYSVIKNVPGHDRPISGEELKAARVSGRNISPNVTVGEPTMLIAPHATARVLDNHFSSLDNLGTVASTAIRGTLAAKNIMTAAELALPYVHAATSANEAFAAGVQDSLSRMMGGDVKGGLKQAGRAIASPYTQAKDGGVYLRHLVDGMELPNDANGHMKRILQGYMDTNPTLGSEGTMSSANIGHAKSFFDSFKHGTLKTEFQKSAAEYSRATTLGKSKMAIKLALHGIARADKTLLAPLFDHYIPRLKVAAFMQQMQGFMRNNPQASEQEFQDMLYRTQRFVDHNYGMQPVENAHFHAATTAVMRTLLTSPSYAIGNAKLMAATARDTARAAVGLKDPITKTRVTPEMLRTVSSVIAAAFTGTVITKLRTGKWPTSFKDAIYPQTGRTDRGKPVASIQYSPGVKEPTELYMHGPGYIGNKESRLVSLGQGLMSGKNYDGSFIAPSLDGPLGQAGDYAKYIASQSLMPLALTSQNADSLYGTRQAPKEISDPEGYKIMMRRIETRQRLNAARKANREKNPQ